MTVQEQDELLHPVQGLPGWQESYYWNFYADDLSGALRLGLHPNRGIQQAALLLWEGQTLAFLQHEAADFQWEALARGPLVFALEVPLQRWRLRLQTDLTLVAPGQETHAAIAAGGATVPVTLEMDFEARTPAYLYPDHALDFAGAGQRHYEQGGQVRGRLRVAEQERSFVGVSLRDHSWGIRDWLQAQEWYWLCLFGPEESFAAAIYGHQQGAAFSGGFVWQEGRLQAVQQVEIEARHGDDLGLLAGQVRLVTAQESLRATLVPRQTAHTRWAQADRQQLWVSATAVACQWVGQEAGHGWVEYGRRIASPAFDVEQKGHRND